MPTVQPQPHALNELVKCRLKELGLSYSEAAKKGGLPKATVANLATQPLRQVPRPQTLLALAQALALPVSTIRKTVAECVGLVYVQPAGNGRLRALVDTVDQLNEEHQETLIELAESLLLSEQKSRRKFPRPRSVAL